MTTDLTLSPLPPPVLASDAWEANLASVERARAAAEAFLTYDPLRMTAEEDEHLQTYLVKARATLEQLQARRAPLTKSFDAIRSQFVQLEAQLDPKKADSVTAHLQAIRDAYAARLRAAEAARQAQLRQAAEQLRQVEAAAQSPSPELVAAVEQLVAEPLPEVPKGRAGVRAEVTHPRAYVALLALYLERETRTLDQLSRLTLGQLTTYAERLATSTGEVLDVEGLSYVETFKTVAR